MYLINSELLIYNWIKIIKILILKFWRNITMIYKPKKYKINPHPIHTRKIMVINQKQELFWFIFHAYIHLPYRGAASVPKLLIQKLIGENPHKIKHLPTVAPKPPHKMQCWTKSTYKTQEGKKKKKKKDTIQTSWIQLEQDLF